MLIAVCFCRCIYDFVDVYIIALDGTKTFYRRYCGNTLPPPVISMHSKIELEFQSHKIIREKNEDYIGFFGQYSFIHQREI